MPDSLRTSQCWLSNSNLQCYWTIQLLLVRFWNFLTVVGRERTLLGSEMQCMLFPSFVLLAVFELEEALIWAWVLGVYMKQLSLDRPSNVHRHSED